MKATKIYKFCSTNATITGWCKPHLANSEDADLEMEAV